MTSGGPPTGGGPTGDSWTAESRRAAMTRSAVAANDGPAETGVAAIGARPEMTADLGELMRTRRAVRRFAVGPVPESDVREVLEAARWAPSPANLQPARFIWVRDAAIKRELQALARESKELSSYWDPAFRPEGKSGLVNDLVTPEVIAVLSDPAKSLTNVHYDNGFEWAAAMSIYAMWLRAHSLGYGGVFVQHWITEKAKRILNVPLRWTFLGTFTFGHAADAPQMDRLPLDELVWTDRVPGDPRVA